MTYCPDFATGLRRDARQNRTPHLASNLGITALFTLGSFLFVPVTGNSAGIDASTIWNLGLIMDRENEFCIRKAICFLDRTGSRFQILDASMCDR